VKLYLLRELLGLNQAFVNVVRGLERMENVPLFDKERLCHTRAEVESARGDANREFFDTFDEIVEKDAEWAYKFCRAYDQKTKDPFDFYVEIKGARSEEEGTASLVMLLRDGDHDDEQRYDEGQAKKRAASRRRKSAGKSKPRSAKAAGHAQTGIARAPERKSNR
jgi:hypothetical protein